MDTITSVRLLRNVTSNDSNLIYQYLSNKTKYFECCTYMVNVLPSVHKPGI